MKNKAERSTQYFERFRQEYSLIVDEPYNEETIEMNKKFLIVCEGENTERYYFEHFPILNTVEVKVVGGYGGSKMYLVNEAEKIAKDPLHSEHEVWCVFDFDVKKDNPRQKQDYDNAIKKAIKKGFKVAYSNDCFELWMVLHYKLIQNGHHRVEYFEMLKKQWALDKSYERIGKEEEFARSIYRRLVANQETAINNAKRLFAAASDSRPYHQMNPCTTVFQLVEELNKYLRR